tara:strand:- start:670 stop:996 length:327 start_codon:yes stop_codon:yes gene_type:complete
MPKLPSDRNAILNEQLYHDVFTKKGVKFLRIRRTADLSPLQGVEMEVIAEHVWGKSDKLHLLSLKYYGRVDFWWVIGVVNKKPTDGHFKIGDVVYIPSSPQMVKELLR